MSVDVKAMVRGLKLGRLDGGKVSAAKRNGECATEEAEGHHLSCVWLRLWLIVE